MRNMVVMAAERCVCNNIAQPKLLWIGDKRSFKIQDISGHTKFWLAMSKTLSKLELSARGTGLHHNNHWPVGP